MSIIDDKNNFQKMVERERARSDRMGHSFSVIFFDLQKSNKNGGDMEAIICLILKRIRIYDDIGCFDGDRIVVLMPNTGSEQANSIAENISTTIYPGQLKYSILSYPGGWINSGDINNLPTLDTWADASRQLMEKLNMPVERLPAWKRLMDILGAASGLVLLAPVLALLSVFIKMVSPGQALFKQTRIGFLGKKFNCYKFRTMHHEASQNIHTEYLSKLINSDVPMQKLDTTDPRIIPCGRFIRMSGIDELPQLFNVLRGDMSLIGPRPCIPYEANEFKLWQRRRFDAMPGITGLWQVSGKNKTSFIDMMRYDIRYACTRNFYLDTAILLKTIPAIIAQITDHKNPNQGVLSNGKPA